MFTADEYRTAARVLEAEKLPGYVALTDDLMQRSAMAVNREKKLRELGLQLLQINQANDALFNAAKLATYLTATGWRAPEGLF